MYNLTNLTSSQSLLDIIRFTNNDATGGLFMALMIVAIFFILLLNLMKWDFTDAILISSWVCFILSSMLLYMKLVPFIVVIAFLSITAFVSFYHAFFKT
jgi:cation transporter-like permease